MGCVTLCKMSFASMLDGTFGYDFGGGMPKKLSNAKDEFTECLSARLENVTIENRDAMDVLSCYDTPDTSILWTLLISIPIVGTTKALSMSTAWRSSYSFCHK